MSIDYEAIRNTFVALAKAKIGSKLATLKMEGAATTPAVVKARQDLPPKPAYPHCAFDIQAVRHNPNDYDGMFLNEDGIPTYYTRVELLLGFSVYGGDAISIIHDLWLCFRQTSVRDYLRVNGGIAVNTVDIVTTSSYSIPNDWVEVATFNFNVTVMDKVVAVDETTINDVINSITLEGSDGSIYSTEITTNIDDRYTGITFGLYPLVVKDYFSASVGMPEGSLKDYPRPDIDYFTSGASLTDGSLVVSVAYLYHTLHDMDSFTSGASLVDGSLITTVAYYTHELYDVDSFTSGANLIDGSLFVTAAYANHSIYDIDTFTAGASLTDGSLT